MGDQIVNYDVDYSKWNVKKCLKDVVWILMVDEPDTDIVSKNGIFIPTKSVNNNAFRVGHVLKVGPKVETVKEGDFIIIPPTVGIYGHKTHEGHKTWFVREDTIISVVEFDGTKDEFLKHVKENLFVGQ